MSNVSKMKAISIGLFALSLGVSVSAVNAQQTVYNNNDSDHVVVQESLDPALLEQVLAPIALYPDALLSQVLVASTYPLEVVQAARWRQDNYQLTESQVLTAVEYKSWDPSIKALAPFTDLIVKLSNDLEWLQLIGDAFLQNEYQVLASVQELRHKAYYEGSLNNNFYHKVVIDNGHIVIESINRDIIHVPYYDTRVVYGHWKWKHYQPVYWRHPSHYRLHAGFYWSSKFYIKPTIFFGGFLWGSSRLVVNHHFYDRPYSRNSKFRKIGLSKYRKWKHNPVHRRGVSYSRFNSNKSYRSNRFSNRAKVIKPVRTQRAIDNRRFSNRVVVNRNDQRRVQQQNNGRNDQRRAQQQSNNRNGQRQVQQRNSSRNDQQRVRQQNNRSQQLNGRSNDKNKLVKQQSSNQKFNKKYTSSNKTQTTNNRVYSNSKQSKGKYSNSSKSYKSQKSYKSNNRFSNQKTSRSKSRFNVSNRNQRR